MPPSVPGSANIHVGDQMVRLNRNDWWGPHAKSWGSMEGNGGWHLEVLEDQVYDIEVNFQENVPGHGLFRLRIGQQDFSIKNKDTTLTQITFENISLKKGIYPIHTWYYENWPNSAIFGPYDVYITPHQSTLQ